MIKNLNLYYGHTKDEKIEFLEEHMKLSRKYGEIIIKNKNLDSTFKKLYKQLIKIEGYEDLFKELVLDAIELHDLGKINKNYQADILGNKNFKKTYHDTEHSKIGSVLYIDYTYNKIIKVDKEVRNKFKSIIIINAYMISKHHGKLKSFDEYLSLFYNELIEDSLKQEYDDYEYTTIGKKSNRIIINLIESSSKGLESMPSLDTYIYSKLVYSLITGSDFYATSDFYESNIDSFGYIEDVNKYYGKFKESAIFENIENYKKGKFSCFEDTPINKLRTEMIIEAEHNLIKNKDKNIYYLEAPTGSGKTACSLNLALKSIELNNTLNKIFYIFPFNTLVEQTYKSMVEYLEYEEDISIINSVTPIKESDENYDIRLLDRQFLHYPITITSHVNFFNILFGVEREETFPLVHLANSVIVLDEIQSYKNSIWKEIIMFLEKYADILNLKIIIMSATLPNLNLLGGGDDSKFTYLINDRDKYFKNPLFKDRVSINYKTLDEEIDIKDFILSRKENKILVEFLTVESATKFYKSLKVEGIDYVELITGHDNKVERNRIIEKIRNLDQSNKLILVSTQVVEAGVDIDMDLGLKDISILDSEEQFLGRINRSCKKDNCHVYFFDKDDAQGIYKVDFRKNYTLKDIENRNILGNKDFHLYYGKVIKGIQDSKSGHGLQSIEHFIDKEVGKLNFDEVKNHMKLIDKNKITLFLNTEIKLIDGSILKGEDIWKKYKNLLSKKISYSEKRVKISSLNEIMDYFTYQIDISYKNRIDGDIIGNMVYIGDGEKYLTEEGKFDISLFKNSGYDIY